MFVFSKLSDSSSCMKIDTIMVANNLDSNEAWAALCSC